MRLATPETTNYRKIATSYVHTAETYFKSKGIDVELIKLNGSVELALCRRYGRRNCRHRSNRYYAKANGLVESNILVISMQG